MEAPLSPSSRLSGTSGWTEAAGSEGLLLLEGVRLPWTGTVEESGTASGTKPDSEPWGVFSPLFLGSGRSPFGSSRTTSSCPGARCDATSASSTVRGETAGGTEFTFDQSGSRSTSRRVRSGAGCIIMFDVRESCAIKEHHELL